MPFAALMSRITRRVASRLRGRRAPAARPIASNGTATPTAIRDRRGFALEATLIVLVLVGLTIGLAATWVISITRGAATDYRGVGWFCPGLAQPDGGGSFTLGFRSGLMVDQHGNRYGNESRPYDQFGRVMAEAPERIPSWYVFDSREGGRLPAIAMPEGDPAAHLEAGTWVRADSLPELAGLIGVPPDDLVATVERFNGFCESGVDEDFGRGRDEYDTFFTGGAGPAPCDQPPFYAARFVLSDLGTKGGLVTDASGRVLRDDGSAIPGLYAASNSAASMFGAVYPGPGAPLGSAMVFASLAVRDMGAG
jgi:3-oxosteroid 1-dehydrogenase